MQAIYIIFIALLIIIAVRLLFRKFIDLPNYPGKLLADASGIDNLMPEATFWQMIQSTKRQGHHNYQMQCQLLTAYLERLSKEEMIQFDRTCTALVAKSYSFKLWEAAFALNFGCSDDAFDYFRSWLVGQGKNKFYWTIRYPRLLLLIGVKELIENYEGLDYCANEAYKNKTGLDIEFKNDIPNSDGGKMFKESEAFLRYPELALLTW
jgi:hypothetical protein